jgi:mannose-6-phosphate isomerase-like protein (cupin superfamily)
MAARYTLKKLLEVEDIAPSRGFDAHQEARFANSDLETEQTGVSLMTVKPGMRQAFAHKHDEAEEVYVVISGAGRVKLDDEIVELERLDALRVSPQVTRQFEGGPDGLQMLAVGARHQGDGEILADWWTD